MIPVPVTALFAGVNALFSLALAVSVTVERGKAKVFLGTGESPALLRATRRHGNNAEYLALALVMLLIVEVSGGSSMVLHGIGGTLTAGRLLHAIGIGEKPVPTRALGAVLTWLAIAGASVYAIILGCAH